MVGIAGAWARIVLWPDGRVGTGCRRLRTAMSLRRNSTAVMLNWCSPLPPLHVSRWVMIAGDRLGQMLGVGGRIAGSVSSISGALAQLCVAGWARESPDLPCARLRGACAPSHADVPSPLAAGGAGVRRLGWIRCQRASSRYSGSLCPRCPANEEAALIRTRSGRQRTARRPGCRVLRPLPGPGLGSSAG